ncbi:hypothetical protein [Flavihumibacter sp. CACIAM 22H1]|uniref:hypothetical protein n=1 Tax=Flavihumibacter sp. CACIAM 22H1 TaxID=1812911 RepID=UPI0007A91AA9|nr:hypothetical protein [Flavihumibacter sp. CACIAM 22H1]KYP15237.1 MAG: hypothetical protein A1D16_15095 [Flavihumibacter sp. CACIAM 22H1]
MINPIRTHRDLLEEKARLKSLLVIQKNQLRQDWMGIEEALEPATKFVGSLGMFTSTKSTNPLLKLGLDLGIDVLLRRTLFKNTGLLTRLGAPILVRNLATNLFDKKGAGLWKGIQSLLKGKNGKVPDTTR